MNKPAESLEILFLCEDEKMAQTDRRMLKDAGFAVSRIMTSGIEAAKLLAGIGNNGGWYPAMAVCSQKLEDMDGEQFCAIIRQHPLLLGFPVLLILPSESEAEQLKTLGCGASALLGRPYSAENLKNRLLSLKSAIYSRNMLKNAASQVDTSAFDAALATYGVLLKPDRDPEDYFKTGMTCLEGHRWNLAISAFEHAMRHVQIKAEAELGMAAAYKGKADMPRCKAWLSRAAHTFVAAKKWQHARGAYAKLLRHDPAAKNPFVVEAHKLIREKRYNDAASVLNEGAGLISQVKAGEHYARLCFLAEDPSAMLHALEEGFAKYPHYEFLGNEIRQSLEILTRQREERNREQAAGRKLKLAQAITEREKTIMAKPADFGLKAQGIEPKAEIEPKVSVMMLEDEQDLAEEDAEITGAEEDTMAIEPFNQDDLTTDAFEEKPRLNEFLSVIKFTWKMAARNKKKK